MLSTMTRAAGRRTFYASAIALSSLLAIPAMPTGFSAGAPLLGAAFARQGADDGPNDNGHHVGGHQRHGKDDPADRNDDHGGKRGRDAGDDHPGTHQHRGGR